MNAWRLPFTVEAFATDRENVAEVLGVPLAAVELDENVLALRVTDADGDPMCDVAIDGCSCRTCSEGELCHRTMSRALLSVQEQLVRMGARPVTPVGWGEPRNPLAIAELRAPAWSLN